MMGFPSATTTRRDVIPSANKVFFFRSRDANAAHALRNFSFTHPPRSPRDSTKSWPCFLCGHVRGFSDGSREETNKRRAREREGKSVTTLSRQRFSQPDTPVTRASCVNTAAARRSDPAENRPGASRPTMMMQYKRKRGVPGRLNRAAARHNKKDGALETRFVIQVALESRSLKRREEKRVAHSRRAPHSLSHRVPL